MPKIGINPIPGKEGIFETIRVKEGIPEHLELHLKRLREGAKFLNITVPVVDYETLIADHLDKNKVRNGLARVKIILSNRISPHFSLISEKYNPPDKNDYLNGVKLTTAKHPYCESETAKIKSICRAPYTKLRETAVRKGCFDCLLTGSEGEILESTIANLFVWDGENFFIPPVSSHRLHGIMETAVVKKIQEEGFTVRENRMKHGELCSKDTLLITNSLIGIMPVRSIDKTPFRIRGEKIVNHIVGEFSPYS